MKNKLRKAAAVFLAAAVLSSSGCLGKYRSYNDIGEAQALALRKAIVSYRNDYVSWLLNETDFDLSKYNEIYLSRVEEAEESPDTYTGTSYLHEAVGSGNYEAAKMLIEHGCDPKYTDWLGHTTPYLAAGNNEMLKLMLDNGADVQDHMMVSVYIARRDRESLEWLERDYGLDASTFVGLFDWTSRYNTSAFTADNPALVWLFERTADYCRENRPTLVGKTTYLGDYFYYFTNRKVRDDDVAAIDADLLMLADEWTEKVGGVSNNTYYYGVLIGDDLKEMIEYAEDAFSAKKLFEFWRGIAYMYSTVRDGYYDTLQWGSIETDGNIGYVREKLTAVAENSGGLITF